MPRSHRLSDLPEEYRTEAWIKSCIRHEEHRGVHTYHRCDCDRHDCRSWMCAECWRGVLAELEEQS